MSVCVCVCLYKEKGAGFDAHFCSFYVFLLLLRRVVGRVSWCKPRRHANTCLSSLRVHAKDNILHRRVCGVVMCMTALKMHD